MLAHHYLQALELTSAAGGSTSSFSGAAREALTDAGDRALALNAYEAAARFFRAALDLLPGGDLRRGRLLLRLGRALYQFGETDVGVLERAHEELLAAGDSEGAAEAETTLCEHFWLAGENDRAIEHLAKAQRIVRDLEPSRVKARVAATASRILMLASEEEQSIRVGEEALAMADQLGLEEIKAAALVNVGSSRAARGEDEGMAMLAHGVEVARDANAPFDLCRGMGNLAAWHWVRGELQEALSLQKAARKEAEQYGQKGFARWFRGTPITAYYEFGEWDEATMVADAFLAEVEAGSPHYLAGECYYHRALIRLGRGDADGAVGDAEQALALARRAKDPQALFPASAGAAHVFTELGDRERALPPAEEFLAAVAGGRGIGFGASQLHMLSWVLTAAGRGPEAAHALGRFDAISWARAGIAFARRDAIEASEILAGIGAITSEAYCRLAAARQLVEEGRRAEADEHLHRALSFYRSVAATRYVREGESLLAASA